MSLEVVQRVGAGQLDAIADPKFPRDAHEPWRLYISHAESKASVRAKLSTSLNPTDLENVNILLLPDDPRHQLATITSHGLLYLPHPNVVPAEGSTRCMARTAISSRSACCVTT